MILKRNYIYGLLVGIIFALAICGDGIVSFFNQSHVLGSYNFLFGFAAFLVVTIGIFTMLPTNTNLSINKNFKKMSLWLLVFYLIVFLSGVKNGGRYSVLAMDLLCISLLPVAYTFFCLFFNKSERMYGFYQSMIMLVGLIFPAIAFLTGSYDDLNRFKGFYGSPSFAGLSSSLVFVILILNKDFFKSVSFTKMLLLFSFYIVIVSGTRAGFAILAGGYILSTLDKNYPRNYRNSLVFLIILISSIFLGILFWHDISWFIGNNSTRITSYNDIENGSLSTRIYWLKAITENIGNGLNLLGNGPGSAQNLIGFIPHFDFLRILHDYGIFSLISVIMILLLSIPKISNSNFTFFLLAYVILNFHNLLMSPILIVLIIAILAQIKIIYEKKAN